MPIIRYAVILYHKSAPGPWYSARMQGDANAYSFWDTVCEDARAAHCPIDRHAPLVRRLLQLRRQMKTRPAFACVAWLRINQLFARRGWRGSFRIRVWRFYRFANDISEYAVIGPGLFLPHPIDVTIGSSSKVGRNAVIYNGVTLGVKNYGGEAGMPELGDNVIVYTGAKLFGPISIGDDATIGALALCTKSVPAHSVMYGIPPNVTIKPKA